MAQYEVPQFIEVEAKIIGPFTLKQFLWLAGAGAIIFILYFIISIKWIWILVTLFIASAAIIIALVKVNGRSMFVFMGNFFSFVFKPRFFLWRKEFAVKDSLSPSLKTPTTKNLPSSSVGPLQKIQIGNAQKISGLKNLSAKLLFDEKEGK